MPQQNVPYLAEGPRVGIRHFTHGDGPEFTARARESRDLHRPWLTPPDTADAYAEYTNRLLDDPTRHGFLVCAHATGAAAGYVTLSNIVQGAFWSGTLGYGAFAHASGRGLMREALGLVVGHAFGTLGLHRLEINVQPRNARSVALARGAGFRLEGYSPQFLYIDGAWRDHERWALTAEMTCDR